MNNISIYTNPVFIKRLKIISPILLRYGLYSFALLESFLLPYYLKGNNYVKFEYYKNLVFIFPYLLLGAHSGFVLFYYTYSINYYKQLYSLSVILILLLSMVISLILGSSFLIIPLCTIGLFTIIEQYLKINHKFLNIFIFKPLLSVLTFLSAYFYVQLTGNEIQYQNLIFIAFSGTLIIWMFLMPNKSKFLPLSSIKSINKVTLFRYYLMGRVFFTGVLLSILLYGLFFFERYFVTHFFSNIAETYTFAFNLSQILIISLTGVSYVTSVYLGERLNKINFQKLRRQFLISVIVYFAFFSLFLLFINSIEAYYPQFNDLLLVVLISSFSKGFLFLVATISHLATYHGYNTLLFKYLFILSIVNIILVGIGVYNNISVFVLLAIDSVIILVYALLLLRVIFLKIDKNA